MAATRLFTNQYLAYETLSDPIRDLLEGLTAVHTATLFGHLPNRTSLKPSCARIADTGRKSLFVNRTFTSHLVEVQRSESDTLLEYLYTWSEQPQFQCQHIEDEGHDRHLGQPLHPALRGARLRRAPRHRARTPVIGDAPFGGIARWQPFTKRQGHHRGYARDDTDSVGDGTRAPTPSRSNVPEPGPAGRRQPDRERGGEEMGTDADVVRRLTEEVFIGGKVDALDDLVADNFLRRDPPPGLPGTKDAFRQLAEMVVAAFSDRKAEA